jgi:hypothetical protein
VKILLSLLPLEIPWQSPHRLRPLALWQLAGKPLAGHLLERLHKLWDDPTTELCLVVAADDGPLAGWLRRQFPGRPLHLLSLPAQQTLLQVAAQSAAWWRGRQPVWLIEGCAIWEADLPGAGQPLAVLLPPATHPAPPLAFYSHSGTVLWEYLNQQAGGLAGDPKTRPLQTHIHTYLPVAEWVETTWQSHETLLLQAHARLLGLGSGSTDAIERSYVEDFTVLPPVYLDESAVVYGAVVGPYTSVEAGATIRHSIVRNSIIGAGAQISHALLDHAIIGEKATVSGRAAALLLGDNEESLP